MDRRGPWTPGFVLAHAALVSALVAVLLSGSPAVALASFLACRAAYAVFVASALVAQDRSAWFTRRWGPDAGYARFRGAALFLMNADGAAFVLACWMGRGTLELAAPEWATVVGGVALCLVGIGVKSWAARSLPEGAYTWRSFFIPPEETRWVATGPYRWLSNPMYTIGYLQCWGLALLLRSGPGLWAAAAAHAGILLVHLVAERPNSKRFRERAAGSSSRETNPTVR